MECCIISKVTKISIFRKKKQIIQVYIEKKEDLKRIPELRCNNSAQ